jgi:hypothetical protein
MCYYSKFTKTSYKEEIIMNDQVWNPSENYDDADRTSDTGIRVNGSFVEIEPGQSFSSAVTETAKQAGLGKFRVFMNDEEVKPSEAPDTITEGMRLDLRPYDVAG